jgi:Holliday junction resolvasome RuvABC endonuclease subunit
MAFLGVDQSLNGTGLCVVDDDGAPTHIETVEVGKRRGAERLAFIESRTESLLDGKIQFVTREGYSYDSTGRVFELGEVGGVLQLLFYKRGLQYAVVAPAALKKFAVDDPRASKEALIIAAKERGAVVQDDNQADAYWLAQIARMLHQGSPAATPRHQLEVLRQIEAPRKKHARRVRRLVKNAL